MTATSAGAPVRAPAAGRADRRPTLAAAAFAAHAELRRREPLLAAFAAGCLALGALAAAAAAVDPRTLGGVSVWLKPAKFFGSVTVFALTWAWLAGLVRPDARGAPALRRARWTLVGAGAFELAYITLQAARGEASHFNTGDQLHAVLYGLMGVGAVALLATNVPLALAVARRPAPDADPELRRAAVLGLTLSMLLGGVLGGYLSAQAGHAVGPEVGHLAVTGWNRAAGDLRVAHFLGLHAEQALPIAARALGAGGGGVRWRRAAVWAAAGAWTLGTLLAFAQCVRGRPFPLG